jgi:SAM-dependent methyltransferase
MKLPTEKILEAGGPYGREESNKEPEWCPACCRPWRSRRSIRMQLPLGQEEMLTGQIRTRLTQFCYGRCSWCSSLIAIDERRDPERLHAIYESLPESYWNQLSPQDRFAGIVEQRLLSRLPTGDLWDVGCGTGSLLGALGCHWKKHGIEPGQNAVALAKEKGFDVWEGTPAQLQKTSVADAITLVDVVEHMLDPLCELSAVYNMLRPGGHLLVFTGDANSLTARIASEKWYYLQCVGHVTVFSACALRRSLEQIGFVNVKCSIVDHQGAKGLSQWIGRIIGNGLRNLLNKHWAPVPYFRDHKLVMACKPW